MKARTKHSLSYFCNNLQKNNGAGKKKWKDFTAKGMVNGTQQDLQMNNIVRTLQEKSSEKS